MSGEDDRGFRLAVTYDDTPASFNGVGSRGGQMAFHREKKRWQEVVEMLMLQTGFPRDWEEIVVSARLRFPVKRKRDEGNFRTLLEKAVGDALVNGGWIPDDVPEHYRFERVHFEQQTGRPLTTLEFVAK